MKAWKSRTREEIQKLNTPRHIIAKYSKKQFCRRRNPLKGMITKKKKEEENDDDDGK